MKELIKKLAETFGPSGFEGKIRETVREEVQGYVDEIRVDALGNLICLKKGSGGGKKILLDSHMDEIGIIVSFIDDDGYLRFQNIGGLLPPVVLGQRVYFENGTLGVVGSERITDPKDLKIEKYFVDIGAKSKGEAEKKVRVGDAAAFFGTCESVGERLLGKALDNRVGCFVVIETLKNLESTPHDVYAVFSTQEEVGLRGAKVAAFGIDPDVGIAFDATRTGDTPKGITMDVALGKGAAIKVKDSSIICTPALKNYMVKIAEENDISYQLEVLEAGGTDSGAIHLTKAGIPSGVISIPCRYVHSPCEMMDMADILSCIELSKALCESPLDF